MSKPIVPYDLVGGITQRQICCPCLLCSYHQCVHDQMPKAVVCVPTCTLLFLDCCDRVYAALGQCMLGEDPAPTGTLNRISSYRKWMDGWMQWGLPGEKLCTTCYENDSQYFFFSTCVNGHSQSQTYRVHVCNKQRSIKMVVHVRSR